MPEFDARPLGLNDRYLLVEILGAGGFATVYRAIDQRFELPVAIKVLADNHASRPEIRERFITEATLQRRLAGCGVVPVFDLGETDQLQPFVVMPLATGGDLQVRLDEGLRATDTDLAAVIDTLASTLGALHREGIVHRDVKPSNLLIFGGPERDEGQLLGPDEHLLLADLGMAKELGLRSGLTVPGGTPGFRPPEQEQLGSVDHRADIYGASALVYAVAAGGAPPLERSERAAGLDRSARGSLNEAIEQGLSAEPDGRPSSVEAWALGLRTALVPSSRHRGRPSGGRGGWGRAAAVAVLAGAVGVGWIGAASLGDADSPVVERVVDDDGTTTIRHSDADLEVFITGPSALTVGDVVAFAADVSGAESWVWVGPDGHHHEAAASFPLRTTRSGEGAVSVIATNRAGKSTIATFAFTVAP